MLDMIIVYQFIGQNTRTNAKTQKIKKKKSKTGKIAEKKKKKNNLKKWIFFSF